MKYSDKIKAKFTMVFGENEINSKIAKLKNMKTGEELEIKLDDDFSSKFLDITVDGMFSGILSDL